jgi:hypothetical protein
MAPLHYIAGEAGVLRERVQNGKRLLPLLGTATSVKIVPVVPTGHQHHKNDLCLSNAQPHISPDFD